MTGWWGRGKGGRDSAESPLDHWLGLVLLLLALAAAGVYYAQAIPRTLYPYDLDFIEDAMLLQAWRVAEGQPVYLPPNADFAPQVYMPLYTWLGGQFFRLSGPAFWPLRLLSLAATTAIAALLILAARRIGASLYLSVACAGLFLAGFRINGDWYELARVDTLYVALALAGMVVAVWARPRPRALVGAGLLLALSTLTKQNGLMLGGVLGAWLLWQEGKRAWRYWLPFAGLTAGVVIWQQIATRGWFGFYVVDIAYASPVTLSRAWISLGREFFGAMGVLMAAWLVACLGWLRRPERGRHPWPIFIGVAIFISVTGRASVGGNLNNLIPGYAWLCLAPALVAAEWRPATELQARLIRLGLTVGLVGQFGLTVWNPMRGYMPAQFRPNPAMRAQGDALINRLRQVDGDVWVMLHPYYAWLAGKTPAVHIQSLWHARERGTQPLPVDLVARLENQTYALIVSDDSQYFERDPALQALLAANYVEAGRLTRAEAPFTLSGVRTRPLILYVPAPRPGAHSSGQRFTGSSLHPQQFGSFGQFALVGVGVEAHHAASQPGQQRAQR